MPSEKFKVIIKKDGPYAVSGGLPLSKEIIGTDKDGNSVKWVKGEEYPKKETYELCRCGQSKNHPYCDGMHTVVGFDGKETATKRKFLEQAEKISGPGVELLDAEEFCAGVRFCHDNDGRVWDLTRDSGDPKSKKIAIKQACNCASGRLVACEKKTKELIEPHHEPSICLIEDPEAKASGPIWLKGGIPLESADGTKYETRNRVTLCRCGMSTNKPFCDSRHVSAKFKDGDKSVEE